MEIPCIGFDADEYNNWSIQMISKIRFQIGIDSGNAGQIQVKRDEKITDKLLNCTYPNPCDLYNYKRNFVMSGFLAKIFLNRFLLI